MRGNQLPIHPGVLMHLWVYNMDVKLRNVAKCCFPCAIIGMAFGASCGVSFCSTIGGRQEGAAEMSNRVLVFLHAYLTALAHPTTADTYQGASEPSITLLHRLLSYNTCWGVSTDPCARATLLSVPHVFPRGTECSSQRSRKDFMPRQLVCEYCYRSYPAVHSSAQSCALPRPRSHVDEVLAIHSPPTQMYTTAAGVGLSLVFVQHHSKTRAVSSTRCCIM